MEKEPNEKQRKRAVIFKSTSSFSLIALGVVILLIILLFLVGLLPRFHLKQQMADEVNQIDLPKVATLEVLAYDKPVELILPSSLDAINITPIWARVNGYIKNFKVDIGDIVKEGQCLADIETPELDHQYEQSLADLARTKARRDIAKVTANRWAELYQEDPEAVARQDVDQKIAELEAADAEVVAADANKSRIENTLNFKHILAPFDGIIIDRNIDMGSLITAGSANHPQQLFKIAKTDIMRVFVRVPQRFFRSIKENVLADVIVSEFPEKSFKGIVARYAKALDPIARTLLTEVHIHNPDYNLLVGLYADVKFLLKPEHTYFLIPTSAVIIRAEGPQVAVLDEHDIVHIKAVTLGLDHGKMMEINSGLQEHDRIITNPTEKIVEGIKVKKM